MRHEQLIEQKFNEFLQEVFKDSREKVVQINFRDKFLHVITSNPETNNHEGYRIYLREVENETFYSV